MKVEELKKASAFRETQQSFYGAAQQIPVPESIEGMNFVKLEALKLKGNPELQPLQDSLNHVVPP